MVWQIKKWVIEVSNHKWLATFPTWKEYLSIHSLWFWLNLWFWLTTLMLEESCICCFQNCAVILFWLHQSCTVKILYYWTYKGPLQADIKTCVWNSVGNNSINRVKVKSLNWVYLAEMIWFRKSKIKIRKKNLLFISFPSSLSLSFFWRALKTIGIFEVKIHLSWQ